MDGVEERAHEPIARLTGTQSPLPRSTAWWAVARCVATSVAMTYRREIRQPRDNVGRVIRFANGTAGTVYRETVSTRATAAAPCVLIVCFRLRGVHGRGHTLFRIESILNTPLFVGFPGFLSKLWLRHDDRDVYRGIYEWDGADQAEAYARSLWRVLALVSEARSIGYQVLPDVRRDEVLDGRGLEAGRRPEVGAWWQVVASP